jgi:hypothetical protein
MLALANKLSLNTRPIYRFVNEHSIDFDGVDDRIITDGEVVQYEHATYSFWCKASETGQNKGIFGNGDVKQGSFNFNWNADRPLLYLGNNYYQMWDDTPAQDDGEWHHWVVYVCKSDITKSKLWVDAVLINTDFGDNSGSVSTYTESLTIGSDQQSGGNSFVGKIDEFAVYDRELTQAEITRMYNTYYSPNRIANGNFAQEGVEEVTNGDFSQEGSQLVGNNDFSNYEPASQSRLVGGVQFDDWNENPGSGSATFESISRGYRRTVVTPANTASPWHQRVTQEVSSDLTIGKHYRFTATFLTSDGSNFYARISELGSGNLQAGGLYSTVANTPRSIDIIFKCTANTNQYIDLWTEDIQSANSFVEVSNISLKEVGIDWSLDTGWSINQANSVAVSDGTNNADILQSGSVVGKFYKATFTIPENNAGRLSVYIGGVYVGNTGTGNTGDFTFYGKASDTTLIRFRAALDFDGTLTNISVKEVGQHWVEHGTIDANNYFSFANNQLTLRNDGTGSGVRASQSLTLGKTYKVTLNVSDIVGNGFQVYMGNIQAITTTGTHEITLEATNTAFILYRNASGAQALNGATIDNVVVQELKHDATNLMLNAGDYQSANPLITSTKSMEFDGADDYMEVQDDSSLQLEGSEASWTFWTRLDSLSGGDQKFFAKSISGTDTNAYQLRTDNADLKFQFFSGAWRTATSSSFFTDLNWVNVTVTIDASNIVRIYKNGVETHNSNIGYSIPANTGEMLFGARTPSSPTNFLNGEMTELGIYNRCLTALEVASLYNQGVPTDLLVSRGDYVASNLVGYWKMGDGTNDEYPVIYDQTNPTLGSELVTNGDFSDGTNNWSSGSGAILSVSNQQLTIQADNDFNVYARQSVSFTDGKTYKIVLDVAGGTTTQLKLSVYNEGTILDTNDITGVHTIYLTIDSGTGLKFVDIINFNNDGTGDTLIINSITIKEVQGNPATMTNMVEGNITNQYPLTKIRNYYRMGDGILDGYPIIQDQTSPNLAHIPTTNLVPNSQVLSSTSGTTAEYNQLAPDGTNTALKLSETAANSQHYSSVSTIPVINGEIYTISVHIKKGNIDEVKIFTQSSKIATSIKFKFSTKTVLENSGATYPAVIKELDNDWFRISFTGTCISTGEMTLYLPPKDLSTYTGDTANHTLFWGWQVEKQNQPTPYLKSDGIAAVRKSSTTNLIEYSEDFSQWVKNSGTTITTNSAISPDGTQNAALIVAAGTGSRAGLDVSIVSGTTYTLSVYLKNNGGNTSVSIGSHGTTQLETVTINNEWNRYTTTFVASSTTTSSIRIVSSGSNINLFAWGAQFEEQTQAETYAKTTGLPVTIDLFTENNYGTMTNMSASDIVEDTP